MNRRQKEERVKQRAESREDRAWWRMVEDGGAWWSREQVKQRAERGRGAFR